MPIDHDRNPTLSDALILVGATALGLSAVRNVHGWYFEGWVRWSGDRGMLANHLPGSTGIILACWTVVLLAIRLRPPRPRLLKLARQPGFAACLAATLGLGVVCIFLLGTNPALRSPGPPIIEVNLIALPCIGAAVAASWAIMAVGGRWRPEPSWIDRAGRMLGMLWLVALVSYWAVLSWGIVHRCRVW